MSQLRAYEVGVKGTDWTRIVHALTASKAKYQYLRDIRESWQDVTFAHLTCHSMGAPRDTAKFRHTADYRGKSEWHIGQRVKVGNYGEGYLVDSDGSANFQVLMIEGKWPGQTIHVHPSDICLCEQ